MRKSTICKIIIFSVRTAAIFAFIMSIKLGNWFNTTSSFFAFTLTFLPYTIERWYHLKLPPTFSITVALFVFAALVLGDYGDFYNRIPCWDTILHSFSGLALAIACFSFILSLYKNSRRLDQISPIMLIFFSFCFAVASGAVWEILEFSCDRTFGADMQLWKEPGITGLIDTMSDIIMDTLGALLSCIVSYIYLKKSGLIKKMRKVELRHLHDQRTSR